MRKNEGPPPVAQGAPAEVIHILKVAYAATQSREKAFAAVRDAGYRKDTKTGRWMKRKADKNMADVIASLWSKEFGGPGSGNFGHEGRPGERGGSMPGGGSGVAKAGRDEALFKRSVESQKRIIQDRIAEGEILSASDIADHLASYQESFGLDDDDPVSNEVWKWAKDNEQKLFKGKTSRASGVPAQEEKGTTAGGTFYHGTIAPRVEKIKAQGLKEGSIHNYDKKVNTLSGKGAVFMSSSRSVAKRYAADLSFTRNSTPAIIEIRVPKGQKLQADKLPETKEYGKGTSYYKLGTVPKEWIKSVKVYVGAGQWQEMAEQTEGEEVYFVVIGIAPAEKEFGGQGSGNWHHEGRPGERGGSAPGDGIMPGGVDIGDGDKGDVEELLSLESKLADNPNDEKLQTAYQDLDAKLDKKYGDIRVDRSDDDEDTKAQVEALKQAEWQLRQVQKKIAANPKAVGLTDYEKEQRQLDLEKAQAKVDDFDTYIKDQVFYQKSRAYQMHKWGIRPETLQTWATGTTGFDGLQVNAELDVMEGRADKNEIVTAIRKRQINEDVIYRGIHTKQFNEDSPHLKWKEGETVQLFPQSFSKDDEVAKDFALKGDRSENAIVFVIKKGNEKIHGVDISAHPSGLSVEKEVITAGHFRVDKYEKKAPAWSGSKTIHYFYLTQIGVF